MAEFNPQVPEQNMPDWSRTSRGTSGDTSMGTLFKGIGDTLGAAVQTGDNFVKNTIEDASRYSKESIDNEMGFNSQQYNPDIAASEQVLSRLQAAKAQGKVSEEYYYQRLSNTMKGLRARFPGYEKEVDQIFSRVTGQNPANAFRDSLLSSINSGLAANKASADKDADYIRQNGYKIPQTVRDDPNISNAQKVSMIQNQESKNYQIDSATKQMEFDTKNQKQLYSNVASQVSADAINKVNQSLGLNNGGFTELLQRFGNGQGISQDNKASLNAALQTVISGVETDLINRGAKATTLSMTEAADIRTKALEPLKQLQTLINSDQYSQAAQLAASLNFQNDQATAAMTKQFPFLQNLSVVNKLGGGQAAGSLMSDWMLKGDNATQLQTFSMKTLAGNVAGAIVTGQMSWGEAGKAIANNQDMSDPKQRAGLMLSVLSGFKYFAANGKQSPSEVAGFVQKAYGENPQNNDFWRAVSDPDKRNLYSTMFAPEITQKIIDSKDPQALETYKQSALNYAQSLPDLRKDAGTTASATIAKRYVDITFNEKTNRLEATLNAAGQKLSQNQNDISQSELRDAQETIGKSVNSLNRVVSVLAPIYKAEGQDPRQMTQKLIESLGGSADPNTPEQNQGMIPWLLSKVGLADKADVTVGGNSGLAATPTPTFMAEEKPAGLVSPGNINLNTRPSVQNSDGSISTVRTISYQRNDGKEVLIPTVSDEGKIMSNQEAMEYWGKKGQNLGVFNTPEQATAYAKKLHEQQDQQYVRSGEAKGPELSTPESEQVEDLTTGDFDLSSFRSVPKETGTGWEATSTGSSTSMRGERLPAGMRNNNPGNIKYTANSARWPGVVGPSDNTDQGDHQLVFKTVEDGLRATYNLLLRKYNQGKVTPMQMIAGRGGWTPGNTQAASNIARTAGLDPNEDIGMQDPEKAARFMRGLFLQEHGPASKRYTNTMIAGAISGRPGATPSEVQEATQAAPSVGIAADRPMKNASGIEGSSAALPEDVQKLLKEAKPENWQSFHATPNGKVVMDDGQSLWEMDKPGAPKKNWKYVGPSPKTVQPDAPEKQNVPEPEWLKAYQRFTSGLLSRPE